MFIVPPFVVIWDEPRWCHAPVNCACFCADGSCSDDPVSLLPQNIPPETSILERSFCCRLRCLLDNTSGFLVPHIKNKKTTANLRNRVQNWCFLFPFQALNFNGRLKCLSLPANREADGSTAAAQLALFAIATAVEPPSVMEIRAKTFIFQTKHRMDFAPLGADSRWVVLGQPKQPPLLLHQRRSSEPRVCFQREADFRLLWHGAGDSRLWLPVHPCCWHDVLRWQPPQKWVLQSVTHISHTAKPLTSALCSQW